MTTSQLDITDKSQEVSPFPASEVSLDPGQAPRIIRPELDPKLFDTLCMLGIFFLLSLSSADFFLRLTFSRNSFTNTIRVSNSFDPDQDRYSVGPDLGPNCLQRFISRRLQSGLNLSKIVHIWKTLYLYECQS